MFRPPKREQPGHRTVRIIEVPGSRTWGRGPVHGETMIQTTVYLIACDAQEGDWFGEILIQTTVYFVNPELICHGGRTPEEFDRCGTGDRVWLQLGKKVNTH